MPPSLQQVACNLCGADDYVVLYPNTLNGVGFPDHSHFRCTSSGYGFHPQIVKCRRCGLVYAAPRYPADAILESYEQVEDPVYEQERDGRLITFRRNLRPLNRLVPPDGNPRRLVDIGCHTGALIQVAREMGWDPVGIEPSRWAAERARARGLPVLNTTLGEAGFPDNTFDAVTTWDVIEHLPDPKNDLSEMRRVLRPGGVIAIHTIDIDSVLARVMRSRWPWLMVMHLYYFSPRTLAAMMTPMGFRVENVSYQGRFLSLGYLTTRVRPYSKLLAGAMRKMVRRLDLDQAPLPVNFGDLFTLFARKL